MRSVLLFLWAAAAAVAAGPAPQYRVFWADAFHSGFRTPAEVDKMIEDLVTAKANAVFLEARHRGAVYYLKSQEPPAEDPAYQKGFDALAYTIEKAHAAGIEVHLWSPVTPLWDSARPPSDPRHIWNRFGPGAPPPETWMTWTASGRVSRSIDLGHPEAARYTAEVFLDALRQYDLDGIHLDYIRYPEDGRYGWNPTAVARFHRIYARDGLPSENDPAWADFRRRQVTEFVRQIWLRALELKPQAKVTASLITWGNGPANDEEFRTKDAYSRVFQDWPRWLEEGILDFGVPMNYFDNTRYSGYLDRWLEFEKNHQFERGILPGLGIYLNTVPATLSQIGRVLAPAASGATVPGIAFYSYASTNTLVNGVPQPPAEGFYRTLGEYFREPAPAPPMKWKTDPKTGNVLGTLTVDGGPAHLADNVEVIVQSDRNPDFARRTATDGTAFFGMLNLPPDRYFVRLARNGRELFRTAPLEVAAGAAVRFDIFLKEADFLAAGPRILRAAQPAGAPGSLIALEVANLDVPPTPAASVPLPRSLAGVQATVNGAPAALSAVYPGRVELLLPFSDAPAWTITVRRDGIDSPPFEVPAAACLPRIVGYRRTGWGYELLATGLGLVHPAPAVGAGGAAAPPYNTLIAPVRLSLSGTPLEVLWAGLEPYQPYRYQINVRTDGPLRGELVASAGACVSPPAPVN